MNKKIKIIDLLNKIANGEEVPIEIKFQNIIYVFNKGCNQYYERGKGSYFDNKLKFDKTIEWNFYGDYLNEEVEVLEDNTEEIEELYIDTHKILSYDREESKGATVTCFKLIIDEINRLKVAINQLRKDKSND